MRALAGACSVLAGFVFVFGEVFFLGFGELFGLIAYALCRIECGFA